MLRYFVIALGLAALATPAVAVEARDRDPRGLVAADGDAVNVVVTVVHAKAAVGGVAPELSNIERYLLKSFPEYRSFTRLSQSTQRLAIGARGRLMLPNKNELVFEHTGWKDGFAAIHLNVGGLDSTVSVKDGGTFFQAGRGWDGGMIVLAFLVTSTR